MTQLADVQARAEALWPAATAESWDAPGLVTGDPTAPVRRILLAVDAVDATVDEALEGSYDLLLVHHPLLLRGVTSVAETGYKGRALARLIRGGCALLAAHTNADIVERGTSALLAERLGVRDARPLVPADAETGLGRVGDLTEPTTAAEFARRVAAALPETVTGVRLAGDPAAAVRRVALCAGAGDSLLGHPEVIAADAYVTADLRHHPASEAREAALRGAGPVLLDVSHWASESLWLEAAAEQLSAALPGVEISISRRRTDPWDLRIP